MSSIKVFRKLAVTTAFILYSVAYAAAVPAYPLPINVTQPDGTTLTIRVYGDERFNYATTIDGYRLKGVGGAYYYADEKNGTLMSTGILAHNAANRNADERTALSRISKGFIYQVAANRMANLAANGLQFGASVKAEEMTLAAPEETPFNNGEEFHSLVILVEFNDRSFTVPSPNAAFHSMLNDEGYSSNGAIGSARDYYRDNSNNKFNPQFDVVGPFMLDRSVFDYTSNPYVLDEADFVVESCELAQQNGVDFSQYTDENGMIRDVFIFYAGYNAAEGASSCIWPARLSYIDGTPLWRSNSGASMTAAAYTSELKGTGGNVMAGIGTFCHEFGHILGWPDFYDTDYNENGSGFNLDVFSLMASGSYVKDGRVPPAITSYERYMVGWNELTPISEAGEYTLEPMYNDKAFVINTSNDGEFFVFEYRNGTINKWDGYLATGYSEGAFQIAGSGSGMLIYHVDRSNNRINGVFPAYMLWDRNQVNAYGDHECMRIVMASKISRQNNNTLSDFGKMFFPGTDNVTEFTAGYSPNFVAWDGYSTGYELYNITENAGTNVTFEVRRLESGSIRDFAATPGQNNIAVSFVSPFSDTFRIVCQEQGGEAMEISSTERTVNFTGLKPSTTYDISVYSEDGDTAIETTTVTTLAIEAGNAPILGLSYEYPEGTAIVLNYLNIHPDNVQEVQWFVNGSETTDTVISPSVGSGIEIMAKLSTNEGVIYLVRYINVY